MTAAQKRGLFPFFTKSNNGPNSPVSSAHGTGRRVSQLGKSLARDITKGFFSSCQKKWTFPFMFLQQLDY